MRSTFNRPSAIARVVFAALWLVTALASMPTAVRAEATGAAALRARHESLREALEHNDYGRPLVIDSVERSGQLEGNAHAVVDHGFGALEAALKAPAAWCDVLILHLNVKHCAASGSGAAQRLAVSIGKKHDQPLADAYKVDFGWKVEAAEPDYLRVSLEAADGPLGTRDYRIVFEAVPLDAGHSFVHLAYSYGYGMAARIAMQGYLATLGAGKVGFSVVGKTGDGQPKYVGNVRGVVERNTMRYYLAVAAYLDSLSAPAAEQSDQRLRLWFAATERYPQQLHEMDLDAYLAMKHSEMQRQKETKP